MSQEEHYSDEDGYNHKDHKLPNDFVPPNLPSKCTWKLGTDKESPHTCRPFDNRPKIFPDIVHAIGFTPLVRLNHIPKSEGIVCEMYAKCEFLNPGGSVKDRIGFRMVQDAEDKGLLRPGYTAIEPTSGNTGIGLAMACAVKGYRCIIVLPDKMSNEKVSVLKALGAEIVRTPVEAGYEDPEGLIAVAQDIQHVTKRSIVLHQYKNASNPLSHYDGTGSEILWQCDNKVDMVVGGAGTGGTISGVGRKMKEKNGECIIIGVDPVGSVLARPESLNKSDSHFFEMEGIGYDFVPTVLDHTVIDRWFKSNDKEAFVMAKRLIREEGLLVGGSSGAAMTAAIKAAKDLKEGQRCVIILPDSIRNYITKFVSDNWMEARNFQTPVDHHNHWWWNHKVSELKLELPLTIKADATTEDAINLMRKRNLFQIAVVNDDGKMIGATTQTELLTKLIDTDFKPSQIPVKRALYKKFIKIGDDEILGKAARVLETENFIFVTQKQDESEKMSGSGDILVGVLTKADILNFLMGNTPGSDANNLM